MISDTVLIRDTLYVIQELPKFNWEGLDTVAITVMFGLVAIVFIWKVLANLI